MTYNQNFGNIAEDLVDISSYDNLLFDIKYATKTNFTGSKIYEKPITILHKDAAIKLQYAITCAMENGYKLKIFDSFRPYESQQKLWNFMPNPDYVSNPETGPSTHCRGIALDLTLVDVTNKELDMGTEFDEFSSKSHHNSNEITQQQRGNRITLAGIMSISGFQSIRTEWWHYQLPNINQYPKYKLGAIC